MNRRLLLHLSVLASTTTFIRAFSSSPTGTSSIPSAILDRIRVCNVPPPRPLVPFHCLSSGHKAADGPPLGLCDRSIVPIICDSDPSSFSFTESEGLILGKTSTDDANKALALASAALRKRGLIKAWRDELSPFVNSFSDITRSYKEKGKYEGLVIERGAAALFSCRGFGVHVNGFVRGETPQDLKLWVGTRSPEKGVCPGMLDHIVAGGIPASHPLPSENVVKECEEEAGIPEDLASRAESVGHVSYNGMDSWAWEGRSDHSPGEGEGYKRDVLFCYDLELPPDFVPTPVDNEVSSFQLMPIQEVIDSFQGGRRLDKTYKANDYLVLADFLVRRGYLRPEDDLYYEIVLNLRT